MNPLHATGLQPAKTKKVFPHSSHTECNFFRDFSTTSCLIQTIKLDTLKSSLMLNSHTHSQLQLLELKPILHPFLYFGDFNTVLKDSIEILSEKTLGLL